MEKILKQVVLVWAVTLLGVCIMAFYMDEFPVVWIMFFLFCIWAMNAFQLYSAHTRDMNTFRDNVRSFAAWADQEMLRDVIKESAQSVLDTRKQKIEAFTALENNKNNSVCKTSYTFAEREHHVAEKRLETFRTLVHDWGIVSPYTPEACVKWEYSEKKDDPDVKEENKRHSTGKAVVV